MKEYDKNTFIQYYNNAWVDSPHTPNTAVRLGVLDSNRIVGMRTMEQVPTDDDITNAVTIDHRSLEWKHVRRPALGYRHIQGGKLLLHATGRRGRVPKGLQSTRVNLSVPVQVRAAILALPSPYPTDVILNAPVADAYRFPSYVSMEEAVDFLVNDRHSVGFAINSLAAVCLGRTAARPFLLLFDGDEVAYSLDGEEWIPNNPSLAKIVTYCKSLEV